MRFRASTFIQTGILSAFVLTLFSACGGSQSAAEAEAPDRVQRTERIRYGNLDRSTFTATPTDLNGDDIPDQISYERGGRLFFVERDFDFDSRPDMFEYYDAEGNVVEQEYQLDFDSSIDSVRFYRAGVVSEKRISTVTDGTVTMWKYYDAAGQLTRLERDTDQDGVPDEWEFYESGALTHIERDEDGDGSPDGAAF